jgi:hypothetical protein
MFSPIGFRIQGNHVQEFWVYQSMKKIEKKGLLVNVNEDTSIKS